MKYTSTKKIETNVGEETISVMYTIWVNARNPYKFPGAITSFPFILNWIMYGLKWWIVYALARGFFSVLRVACDATIQTNWLWSERCNYSFTAVIIVFATRYDGSIHDNKTDDIHISTPCYTRSAYALLMTSQSNTSIVTRACENDVYIARYRFYSRWYSRSLG